jgi:hypothetical protein
MWHKEVYLPVTSTSRTFWVSHGIPFSLCPGLFDALGNIAVLLEEAGELYSSIIHVYIRLKSDSFYFFQ